MANARPNARGPNPTYIPLAYVGARVGSIGGSRWVCGSLSWIHRVFRIPTCWYRQCQMLALGVKPKARTQGEQVRIAVEYRFNKKGKHILMDELQQVFPKSIYIYIVVIEAMNINVLTS